jgi:hypothetical protein
MRFKEKFQDKEWDTILWSPIWILTAIKTETVATDDLKQEKISKAFTDLLFDAEEFDGSFTKDVFSGLNDAITSGQVHPDSRNAIEGLQEVANLINRKLPDETSDEFKQDLLRLGILLVKSIEPSEAEAKEMSEGITYAMAALYGA